MGKKILAFEVEHHEVGQRGFDLGLFATLDGAKAMCQRISKTPISWCSTFDTRCIGSVDSGDWFDISAIYIDEVFEDELQ